MDNMVRHGAHCRKRSFPTTCRRCGASVYYWECIHGVKVFFVWPIYGKPIRHICPRVSKNKHKALESFEDQQKKLMNREMFRCLVCGRTFKDEKALSSHFKKMKSQDDRHADFYENVLDTLSFDLEKEGLEAFKIDQDLAPNTNVIFKTRQSKQKKKKPDEKST